MDRWRGKTALVTGASAGIGYAIARGLAEAGVNVVGCARNPASLEELKGNLPANAGQIHAITCDLVKEDDITNLFTEIESKFGHVDILINNAGGGTVASLAEGKTEGWRRTLELNILCTAICTRETLRLLTKDSIENGHIININSVAGHESGVAIAPGIGFYSGTKHMLTALTKALYTELTLKKSKIRVTSLSPGLVNTRAVENGRKLYPEMAVLTGQALESKDISDAVLYVLGTPPHVVIRELTIVPLGQP